MSYILEALAKSQRERDLGRVPTPTGDSYRERTAEPRNKTLLISILLLAAIALGSAIYAALSIRGNEQATHPVTTRPVIPAVPATAQQEQGASSRASQTVPKREPSAPRITTAKIDQAPLIYAEPRKRLAPPAATHLPTALAGDRQMNQEKPLPAAVEESREKAPPVRPVAADLRQELIELKQRLQEQEIESRRHGLSQQDAVEQKHEKVGTSDAPSAARETLNMEPRTGKAPPAPDQQLPADVYNRLPARRLSVLAYSNTPGQRFVIVNSQKMLEGNRSREGLVVEEIRPDGVVFSFEGHRFFDPP